MNDKNEQLRQHGLRATMPRMKIIQLLEQAKNHHMSAEDIHQQLRAKGEAVGLATVYRVLTQFEEAGLVSRLNFEGGYSVFELNHGEHHDHIVCIHCGKVNEFVDQMIEKRQLEIAKEHGFTLTDHSLTIYGACSDC